MSVGQGHGRNPFLAIESAPLAKHAGVRARRRERLKQFDLSDEQLARLHGPVGLYIGSKTPAEIAISILAEMTAVKNGVPSILLVNHADALTPPGTNACMRE